MHITLTTSHTGAQTCARSVKFLAKDKDKARLDAKEQARLLAAQSRRGKERLNPAEGMPSDSEDKDGSDADGKDAAELHKADTDDDDPEDDDDPPSDDADATEGFLADRD